MEQRKLTGLLIDVDNNNVEVRTIDDELENFHKMLNCQYIDVVSRIIGGQCFDIVCDDEGLLTGRKLSAVDRETKSVELVGNLFIVSGADSEGEFISLNAEQIDLIQNNIVCNFTSEGFFPVLVIN